MGDDHALSLVKLKQLSLRSVLKLPLQSLNSFLSDIDDPLIAGVDSCITLT